MEKEPSPKMADKSSPLFKPIDPSTVDQICSLYSSYALLTNDSDSVLYIWHGRLGHLNVQDVIAMRKNGSVDNEVN